MTPSSNDKSARISSLAVSTPEFCIEQGAALEFLKKNYTARLSGRSMSILEKVLSHPSIRRRHFAFDDPRTLVDEDPDRRMERFTKHAVELSSKAVRSALERSGTKPEEVRAVVVNTCTGYICPGISTYLVEELKLNRDTKAFDLVGSGCAGAIPNMLMCRSVLDSEKEGAVVGVSVEISSATFQMENDLSLLVSNALFGDGAAAAVWRKEGPGLALLDSEASHVSEYRDDIRFVYKNGQLHNQLSQKLPELASRPVSELINKLLSRNNLSKTDIDQWALHPGGEKVLNAMKAALSLDEAQLGPSRKILSDYGNMSSPSVLFIIESILKKGVNPGGKILAAAFGAGFSAYGCVLENRVI